MLSLSLLALLGGGLSHAADRKLAELVMPQPKLLAGLNMDRVKSTATGRFVLRQIATRSKQLESMTTFYGVNPGRSVHELLIASTGTSLSEGLALVRGKFDLAAIQANTSRHGGISERYKDAIILENGGQTMGLVVLSKTMAAAGDVASVKGVIDRQSEPAPISASLVEQVGRWSESSDLWAISPESPIELIKLATGAVSVPPDMLRKMVDAAGGLKLFPKSAALTAQANTDTPETATALGATINLLANFARMNAAKTGTPAVIPTPTIGTEGATLKLSANVTDVELKRLLTPDTATKKTARKKK
jgi:hypothetical protein